MGLERKQDLPSTSGRTTLRMSGAPHLLMVPYPAQPHILPLLGLARLLARQSGLKITFACHQRFIERLLKTESDASESIQFVGVPDKLPGFEKPSEFPDRPIVLQESLELGYCMGPYVDQLLEDQESLKGPTFMISDWINWWTKDISAKLGIPRYSFSANPAAFMLCLIHCPPDGLIFDDDDMFKQLPGLPPIQKRHIVEICRNDYAFHKVFLGLMPKSVVESDGLLVNTCLAVESDAIDVLRDTVRVPSIIIILLKTIMMHSFLVHVSVVNYTKIENKFF